MVMWTPLCDWFGAWYVCWLHRGSSYLLSRTMVGSVLVLGGWSSPALRRLRHSCPSSLLFWSSRSPWVVGLFRDLLETGDGGLAGPGNPGLEPLKMTCPAITEPWFGDGRAPCAAAGPWGMAATRASWVVTTATWMTSSWVMVMRTLGGAYCAAVSLPPSPPLR